MAEDHSVEITVAETTADTPASTSSAATSSSSSTSTTSTTSVAAPAVPEAKAPESVFRDSFLEEFPVLKNETAENMFKYLKALMDHLGLPQELRSAAGRALSAASLRLTNKEYYAIMKPTLAISVRPDAEEEKPASSSSSSSSSAAAEKSPSPKSAEEDKEDGETSDEEDKEEKKSPARESHAHTPSHSRSPRHRVVRQRARPTRPRSRREEEVRIYYCTRHRTAYTEHDGARCSCSRLSDQYEAWQAMRGEHNEERRRTVLREYARRNGLRGSDATDWEHLASLYAEEIAPAHSVLRRRCKASEVLEMKRSLERGSSFHGRESREARVSEMRRSRGGRRS